MSSLNLPRPNPQRRKFDPHVADGLAYEGFATSNANQSLWRLYPNLDKPFTEASVFVNTPKDPSGPTNCTAVWDCDPEKWQGRERRTSGIVAEEGIQLSYLYPNSEGNIGSASWLQGGKEIMRPPSAYPFEEGQSRLYDFPVMVIADKLNIPDPSITPLSDLISGLVVEVKDWDGMDDDGHRIKDVDHKSGDSETKLRQQSSALTSGRNTRY